MIDKQKIQQAANNYIGHEPEIDEGCNVSARREAFKDGVDWFKKNIWHSCQEEPETVCQFTGVEDDYGNELYEHDYVKASNSLATQEILWSDKEAAFILKYEDDDAIFTQMGNIWSQSLMKIGNAFMYQHIK